MFDWIHDLRILSIVFYMPLAGRARDPAASCGAPTTSRCATSRPRVALRRLPAVAAAVVRVRPRRRRSSSSSRAHAWIPSIGVRYHFGIDGIALLLVLLTTLLGVHRHPVVLDGDHDRVRRSTTSSCCCCRPGMLGVFCALDFFLFYVFWEVMLVPMYFLIGIWGGAAQALRRDQVLPLHAGRLGADAARHPGPLLPVASGLPGFEADRHLRRRRSLVPDGAQPARRAPVLGLPRPSSSASRSRCRCSRSTPGCPTPTSRRPPRAR